MRSSYSYCRAAVAGVSLALLFVNAADARSMARGHGPAFVRANAAISSRPAVLLAPIRAKGHANVVPVARSAGFTGYGSRHNRSRGYGFKPYHHFGYGSFGYGFAAPLVGSPFYDGHAGGGTSGKLVTLQQNHGTGYGHGGRARVYLGHPAQLARSASDNYSASRYFATAQPAPLPRVQFVAVPPSKSKVASVVHKKH